LNKIKEYEAVEVNPEFVHLKEKLMAMTVQYENSVAKVMEFGSTSEVYDFHARRMVEMAGYIIMGYLLLIDTCRCNNFRNSAEIFITYGQAENSRSETFICNFDETVLKIMKGN